MKEQRSSWEEHKRHGVRSSGVSPGCSVRVRMWPRRRRWDTEVVHGCPPLVVYVHVTEPNKFLVGLDL